MDVIRIAARRKSIVGDHRDEELSQLNAITTSFLDLAESRARRHIVTTMEDWKNRLKLLLETMDYDAKNSAGKVSQEEAREKAYSEYEKYKVIQDRSYISDFDRFNSGNDDDTPLLPFNIDPKELGLSRVLELCHSSTVLPYIRKITQ